MSVSEEEAIRLATDYYVSQGFAVVRSRNELPAVRADCVLVFERATLAADVTLDPPGSAGLFWWVAFEEYERVDGRWKSPSFHPSGGLVRVDAVTGELYHPPAL